MMQALSSRSSAAAGVEHVVWQGPLLLLEDGKLRTISRRVALKANFLLPEEATKLVVERVVVRAPFPSLADDGLRCTLQHNQPVDPDDNFLKFTRHLAQKTDPTSGVAIPDSGKYARLALVFRTREDLKFYIKSPEGNPEWLTSSHKLLCFQSLEDASHQRIPATVPQQQQQQQQQAFFGMVPPTAGPQPAFPYPQQYPTVQQPLHTNISGGFYHGYPPGSTSPEDSKGSVLNPHFNPYFNPYQPYGQPFPPYPYHAGFPPHAHPPPGWGPPPVPQSHPADSGQGSSAGTAEQGRLGGEAQQSPKSRVKSEDVEKPKSSHAVIGVDRSFLGTQAQSHPFLFGAIAELVDNAWDQAATEVHIGVMEELREPIFYVRDNGNGMDAPGLCHMFRQGHKREAFNREKLGKYGVGFKSGSMRIGRNAVVFTRKGNTGSIGLLSQDLLGENDTIELPMVTFRMPECEVDESVQSRAEAEVAQAAIEEVTPFSLHRQVVELTRLGEHGTVVFISKLGKKESAKDFMTSAYELSWTEDDVQLPDKIKRRRPGNYAKSMPLDWSLRAYLSYLYMSMKDREFNIYLQGALVPSGFRNMKKKLTKKSEVFQKSFPIHYEPDVEGVEAGKDEKAQLLFGFLQDEAENENCGVCIYWRHRLITSFDTMDMMTQRDFGIVGFLSSGSILNPANHKQAFVDNTENFAEVEKWVRCCFEEYIQKQSGITVEQPTAEHKETRGWAQCDKCGKWRRLPPGVPEPGRADSWFCWRLPADDPFRDCAVKEEEVTDGEVTTKLDNNGLVQGASSSAPADTQTQQSKKQRQPPPPTQQVPGYKRLRKLGDR